MERQNISAIPVVIADLDKLKLGQNKEDANDSHTSLHILSDHQIIRWLGEGADFIPVYQGSLNRWQEQNPDLAFTCGVFDKGHCIASADGEIDGSWQRYVQHQSRLNAGAFSRAIEIADTSPFHVDIMEVSDGESTSRVRFTPRDQSEDGRLFILGGLRSMIEAAGLNSALRIYQDHGSIELLSGSINTISAIRHILEERPDLKVRTMISFGVDGIPGRVLKLEI